MREEPTPAPASGRAPTTPEASPSGGMRARHRSLLLRYIWARRDVSRADLARLSGLSRSTISAIVSDLLSTGLVRETRAGVSNGGRRPIMLGFEDRARTIVGFEIGATHISAALTDLRGGILATHEAPVDTREAPEAALRSIVDLTRELGRNAQAPLLGVGVALPSPIDPITDGPLASVLPRWAGLNVRARLESLLAIPVRVDNDANAGALAELWWGEPSDGPIVFIKVATGVGAGLVIDGQIHRGRHGVAGELGHLSVDPNGPPCVCGANGCLNVVIGTPALLARTEARRPHFPSTRLSGAALSVEALVEAAHHGDPLALEIIAFAGARLGDGIANLLNILDPETIVVGGALAAAGEHLLEPMRRTIRRRTALTPISLARVVQSRMDQPGIAIGAATQILEAALKTNEIPLVAGASS